MWWLLVMMLGASGMDLATTEIALERGYSEMNPLIQNRAVRITTKLVVPIGIFLATQGHSRKKRIFYAVLASSIWAAMAGWNIHVMYTHPL